ncbi:MAG: hypothetical protein HS115_12300 [Spirochaetales bacterium]|nr:hypothetical protein [Spirochaetales bacterium]
MKRKHMALVTMILATFTACTIESDADRAECRKKKTEAEQCNLIFFMEQNACIDRVQVTTGLSGAETSARVSACSEEYLLRSFYCFSKVPGRCQDS